MNSVANALRLISTLQKEHQNAVGHPPLILRVGAKLALVKSIKNGLIGYPKFRSLGSISWKIGYFFDLSPYLSTNESRFCDVVTTIGLVIV